jgi:predicted RNase H-like nuclease (RuvC/YqgF family)
MIGTVLNSCNSSDDKSKADPFQDAKSEMAEPRTDSLQMDIDTIAIYQDFIKNSEARITAYEKEIAEVKNKIAEVNKKEQSEYKKKLALLEEKTKVLKANIISYKDKKIKDWNEKQVEFKKDMDELGHAITNFFENEK